MSVLVPTVPLDMVRAEFGEDRWAALRSEGAMLRRAARAAGAGWATRDTSVAWMTFMGIPQGGDGIDTYDRLSDFAHAPADVAWVYACVNRIAEAAASVPLRVYVKAGTELTPWEDGPSNPAAQDLQQLLDYANPVDMTGAELRAYTAASRKVWGGWYWKQVRGRLLHDTQELYWLRVPDVIAHSDDGRAVDFYEYRPSRTSMATVGNSSVGTFAETIEPQDMIRQRGLNLGSQIDMMSPLSAARFDMVTDNAASMQTASVLRRRGVPEGYWKAAPNAQLTRQDQSAIRRWIRQLQGPRNAGRSLIAPDLEYVPLQLPEKDAEWLLARKVSRMMVSAILGVPLVLAGDDEHAGVYRSIRDAQTVFWRDTMIVELGADADTVNHYLVPEFNRPGDPQLVVAFDFSGVEAIKPLWQEEWNGWLGAIDRQAITPNRFIDHFKLGAHVPWGDKPVPKTTVTIRPQDAGNLAANLPFLEGEASTDTGSEDEATPSGESADVAEALRAFSGLYTTPAVRAFMAGGPLDLRALGLPESARAAVEEGIRRREPAARIADRIAVRDGDVAAAVVGQLRAQWPDRELDIVRRGSWTFDPAMKLKKIAYGRRPVPRNLQKVADMEQEISVTGQTRPAVIVKDPATGDWTPIDGWHHLLAADHVGLKKVPAYVGEGDPAWVGALLKFNDTIPTPTDGGTDS